MVFYTDSVDLLESIPCLCFQVPASDGAGRLAGQITRGQVPRVLFHSGSEKELLNSVQAHGTHL